MPWWILVVLALMCQHTANAIKFSLSNSELHHYRTNGYRPYPHYRVGIYSRVSAAARFAGRDRDAYIDVDVRVHNAPHGFVQLYAYRAEAIEWGDALGNRSGAHPCMDVGQEGGAGITADMREDAFVVNAVYPAGTAATDRAATAMVMRGRISMRRTGLYIISLNACRYVYVDEHGTVHTTRPIGLNVTRRLDLTRWHEVRLDGTIDAMNPYGGMPGQGYGYIPCYALFFVLCLVAAGVAGTMAWRVGHRRVMLCQWCVIALCVVSAIAYFFVLMYVGVAVNEHDDDGVGMYAFAEVLLEGREVFAYLVAFFIALGYGITRSFKASTRYFAGAVTVAAAHAVLRLARISVAARTGARSVDHATVARADTPVAQGALEIMVAALTALTILIIAIALRFTYANIATSDTKRLWLYRKVGAVFALHILASFIWWCFTTFAHRGAGTMEEARWQLWWLHTTLFDGFFVAALLALVVVLRPMADARRQWGLQVQHDLEDFVDLPPAQRRTQRLGRLHTNAAAAAGGNSDEEMQLRQRRQSPDSDTAPAVAYGDEGEVFPAQDDDDRAP